VSVVGPNRSWAHTRAARALVVVLASSSIVAAALIGSNLLTGRITVDEEIGITGTLPTTFVLGENHVSTFTVVSYTDNALNAYLVLTITGANGTAIVTIAGNSIVPSCDVSGCAWTGLSFSLPGHGSVPVDVGITFSVGGEFAWSVQAWAS